MRAGLHPTIMAQPWRLVTVSGASRDRAPKRAELKTGCREIRQLLRSYRTEIAKNISSVPPITGSNAEIEDYLGACRTWAFSKNDKLRNRPGIEDLEVVLVF